jgi:hypothetical protein
VDRDLGRQIVGQVVQMPPDADWHQDAGRSLLDGIFHHSNWIEDRFDGTVQVQTARDCKPTFDALLKQRRAGQGASRQSASGTEAIYFRSEVIHHGR